MTLSDLLNELAKKTQTSRRNQIASKDHYRLFMTALIAADEAIEIEKRKRLKQEEDVVLVQVHSDLVRLSMLKNSSKES